MSTCDVRKRRALDPAAVPSEGHRQALLFGWSRVPCRHRHCMMLESRMAVRPLVCLTHAHQVSQLMPCVAQPYGLSLATPLPLPPPRQ